MNHELHRLIVEVLAAWHEHELYMQIGGHEAKRLNKALGELESELAINPPNRPAVEKSI